MHMANVFIPPLRVRKIKAEMELKAVDLWSLADAAGVEYTRASKILNGRMNDEDALKKLTDALANIPMPKERKKEAA